jgi:lactam utilization protein B
VSLHLLHICPPDLPISRPWKPDEAQAHIKSQVENGTVTAVTGEEVQLPIGDHQVSLCCHSDSPGAVEIVTAARQIVDQFNKKYFPQL